MYEHTNLQSAQIEHQLAVRLANDVGQHVPMSPWRQATVAMRLYRAERVGIDVMVSESLGTQVAACDMPRRVMQIDLATR